MKRAVICFALAAVSVAAIADTNVIGVWKGAATLDAGKLPKAQNPQQQKRLEAIRAAVKKIKVVLTLKKGGAYSVLATGVPGPTPTQTEEGKWTLSGLKITTTATKQNGKAPAKMDKQVMTLDSAHKHLTLVQGPVTMIFTR